MMLAASPCVKNLWAQLTSMSSSRNTVLDEVLLEDNLKDDQIIDRNHVETLWTGNLCSEVDGGESVNALEQALYSNIATDRAWNTTLSSPEYRVLRHTLLRVIVMRAMAKKQGQTPIVFEAKTVALGNDLVFKCKESGDVLLLRVTSSGASNYQKNAAKRRLHPLDEIAE
jgi:hypothetical protein